MYFSVVETIMKSSTQMIRSWFNHGEIPLFVDQLPNCSSTSHFVSEILTFDAQPSYSGTYEPISVIP